MGKIKIEKKDIWIDMTPMSDVMTLLLCFFMLTSTFLTPEPVKVNTPSSVSEVKVPENDVLNILVSPEGNIYVGSENKNTMVAMMETVTDKFGVQLNGTQLKHFKEDAMIGAPMALFADYLNLDTEKMGEEIQKLSIPLDSIEGGKSEFQEWVTAAREANPDIRLAIKADAKTSYAVIKKMMSELQDMNENRYQLITNLDTKKQAEISVMAKKKASKQKKMDTRVNFTPMVDMMMLLITFFMLCTTLAKPQSMQLTMPSNDDNVQKEDKSVTKASHTITLYLGADNQVWYIAGLPNYEDPSCVKKTTYGAKGIRDVLINHTTEEGVNPVAKIMLAKKELDAKKTAYNSKMTDQQYQEELSKLKKGELPNGEKVPTMTVIIRPLDTATYDNMVSALDEMLICNIDKYVIDKIGPEDRELITKAGVK